MHNRESSPARAGDTVFMDMGPLTHPAQMYIGTVLLLDGEAPDPADVAAHVDQRLHRVPGLRHRYLERRVRARWQPHHVHAADHIARADLTDDDVQDINTLVGAIRRRPPAHPCNAPLWDILITPGTRTGQWALVFRAHHSQMDGGAITHTLDHLFGTTPPAQPHPRRKKTTSSALREIPAAATAIIKAATRTVSWPAPPPAPDTDTPTYAVTESMPVHKVKQPGATVSQVFTACFALTADTWSPLPGDRKVHVVIPVDLRAPGEQRTIGNHFAPLRLALPTGTPDRVLREVITQMSAAQRPGFRAALDTVIGRLTPFPAVLALGRRISAGSRCRAVVSSVRSKNPLSYADNPVLDLVPIAPTFPGHALSCLLWTYQDHTRTSFASHTGMPPVDDLPQTWEQALKAIDAPR